MLSYKPIDDLTFQAMYSVLQGGMKLLNDLERFLSPYGLSQGRLAILLAIVEADGAAVTPSQLADVTGKSRPTVTKMLDRLLEDKLIRKKMDVQDKRARILIISNKGEKLLNRIIPLYNERILQMSAPLTAEDKKNLTELISRIAI